jgi:hypothetical protein
MQSNEIWRRVVGFERNYEISSLGRVRSLKTGRILKLGVHPAGRLQVNLTVEGRGFTAKVHRLVAQAFIGAGGPGQVVCHNDGDFRNNVPSNLRWDTQAENLRDTVRHGHHYWANRTRCIRDHEYTEANTAWDGNARVCRRCAAIRLSEHRARKRVSA